MNPSRLTATQLAEHLAGEVPTVRQAVLALRRTVLDIAPEAAEAIKFHCLCYFHGEAPFGAIGGNICMIEVRRGVVSLSFIHGAGLDDPDGLLQGRGKSKRRAPIADGAAAADPRIAALIRRAADL